MLIGVSVVLRTSYNCDSTNFFPVETRTRRTVYKIPLFGS